MQSKYRRVVIKLSGGALAGKDASIDQAALQRTAQALIGIRELGVETGVVVGGGNILRGRSAKGMNRNIADNMGMLATVINSLALQDALEQQGASVTVMSALWMPDVCEAFTYRHAVKLLAQGEILVFAGGTGHPFISTDTTAALRGAQIGADALLLAKAIDGIYDRDPLLDPNARKYDELSYDEVIAKGLQAIDQTAVMLCKERALPIVAFGLSDPANLKRAVFGEKIGTIVK